MVLLPLLFTIQCSFGLSRLQTRTRHISVYSSISWYRLVSSLTSSSVCRRGAFGVSRQHRRVSCFGLACVASVSMRFQSKKRGTRVKDRQSFHSSRGQTENPISQSFFAPKPNGNACYAGWLWSVVFLLVVLFQWSEMSYVYTPAPPNG